MSNPSESAWSKYWPIIDEVFVRQAPPRAPFSMLGRDVVSRLKHHSLDGALYLRGSCLEEANPHAKADIDLVYISSSSCRFQDSRKLVDLLRYTDRPVDLLTTTFDELIDCKPLALLVGYRSLRILGEPVKLPLLRCDRSFVLDHWKLYSPVLLSGFLVGPNRARVCMVKQLVRSMAILRLLERNEFSRDLDTCAEWAEEANPEVGATFRRALQSLVAPIDVDLRSAISWLLETFESRLGARFDREAMVQIPAPPP